MIFCLSISDAESRVILDEESHGESLDVIEAGSWIEARDAAEASPALDPFNYLPGMGWVRTAR